MRNLMYTAQLPGKGSFVIRYPRGRGELTDWQCPFEEIPVGKGRKLKDGKELAVISLGPIGKKAARAIEAAEKEQPDLQVAHYDLRFLKPLDQKMLHEVGKNFKRIITVEDGVVTGGMGTAIMEFMAEHGYTPQIERIGIPDQFIEHGKVDELYAICGMNEEQICNTILNKR